MCITIRLFTKSTSLRRLSVFVLLRILWSLKELKAKSRHPSVTLATQQCEAGVLWVLSLSSLTLRATKQYKYTRYRRKGGVQMLRGDNW